MKKDEMLSNLNRMGKKRKGKNRVGAKTGAIMSPKFMHSYYTNILKRNSSKFIFLVFRLAQNSVIWPKLSTNNLYAVLNAYSEIEKF